MQGGLEGLGRMMVLFGQGTLGFILDGGFDMRRQAFLVNVKGCSGDNQEKEEDSCQEPITRTICHA